MSKKGREVAKDVDLTKVDRDCLLASAFRLCVLQRYSTELLVQLVSAELVTGKNTADLLQCDHCNGFSTKEFMACPYCGVSDDSGKPEEPSDV